MKKRTPSKNNCNNCNCNKRSFYYSSKKQNISEIRCF